MEVKAEVEEGKVKEESALQALTTIYQYCQQRKHNGCENSCVFYRLEHHCILYLKPVLKSNIRIMIPSKEETGILLTDEDAFDASTVLCQWCKAHEGAKRCDSVCTLSATNVNRYTDNKICPFCISIDVRDAILARGLIKKKARARKKDNRSALRRILGASKGDK